MERFWKTVSTAQTQQQKLQVLLVNTLMDLGSSKDIITSQNQNDKISAEKARKLVDTEKNVNPPIIKTYYENEVFKSSYDKSTMKVIFFFSFNI